MYLTILMPCLNEEESIAFCIEKAKRFLERSHMDGEILIADNNSSDTSRQIAQSLGARVVVETRKGYGSAVQKGIREAAGDYIIIGDCDGSYDFEHLDAFISKFQQGYDFVCGNRFRGDIQKGAMPFSHRLGAPFLSSLARLRCRVPIRDFHCGLRGGKTELAKSFDYKCSNFTFTAEQIMLYSGYRVCEIPIVLYKDKRTGRPHLRTVRDGLKYFIYVLGVRKRRGNCCYD